MTLELFLLGLAEFVPSWQGKVAASVLVAVLAVASAVAIRRVRTRIEGHVSPIWVDLIVATLTAGIVIASIVLVADIWDQTTVLLDQLGFLRVDERAPQVALTIVIVIAIQVFVGIGRRLLTDIREESDRLTDHQHEIGVRSTQLGLWGIGLMVILGIWEVDLTGFLVGAGFVGIVLGLASQKTLGSLIAGLILMVSRPFEVGDWVAVGEKEGIVTDITLMSTRIRSFDGERVVVPNDVITSEVVANRSREGRLRVDVPVGIDYDDDIEYAESIAMTAATDIVEQEPHVLDRPAPSISVDAFGDSAVELTVRVWVDEPAATTMRSVRNALIREIRDAFTEADIDIPYPQRELSTRSESTVRVAGDPAAHPDSSPD